MDLVFKFLAVYRAPPSASAGWIAGLDHEIWDYAVEDDVVVVASLSKGREILTSLVRVSDRLLVA